MYRRQKENQFKQSLKLVGLRLVHSVTFEVTNCTNMERGSLEEGGTICLSQPHVSVQRQQPHMLRCIPATVIPALCLFALFLTEHL